MEFAFFYPLAWLGALAVALPIWLHLHRRRESNLVLFSALRFLDDQPIARQRPLWPRDLPLLLLRILGLLLVIAAFAWPYLHREEPKQLVTESVVYILDNTLSHQAQGQFEAARNRLARRLESSPPAQQSAVIELSTTPRLLGGFSDDSQMIADRVRQRKPSFGRGSYLAAFRQADELLRESLGEHRRIVVLADHQANQWHEGRQSPPFLRNTTIETSEPPTKSLANVAIWEPRAQRVLVGDRPFIQCDMRLFHQGPAEKVFIEVRTNGSLVGEREVDVKGEPQIMNVAFEWPAENLDWVQGELRVSGTPNELEGDDRAVFSLPPQRPGKVYAVGNSSYMKTALAPEIMQHRWEAEWFTPEQLVAQSSPPDVLCIELGQLHSKPMRDYVLQHLNQGRGMILMIDELTASGSAFLRQWQVEAQPRVEVRPDKSKIRYFYSEHPLFAPFQSGELGNLLEVGIHRYHPLVSERGIPLAFADAGEPVLMQIPAKGPLLLFAFAIDRRDTNWPIHISFIPFLDLCLRHVRPLPPALQSLAAGEACTWNIPPAQDVSEVVVRRGRDEIVRAKVEGAQARFVLPAEPGLYALHYDRAAEPAAMLEVNPSPAESELAYTDPDETLAGWKLPDEKKRASSRVPSAANRLSEAAILRQHVWWWLLLSGVAALVIETGWLALRKDGR